MLSHLNHCGHLTIATGVAPETRAALRESLFSVGVAGTRSLLDIPVVTAVAKHLKQELIAGGLLESRSVAIQAIAFDKTDAANWKVTWHQDLMFPFAERVSAPGYSLACLKDGIHFARPPLPVLRDLLAVRLHLDDCDESNGPLRVAPASHLEAVIPSAEIRSQVIRFGEVTCLAKEGEAVLMKPLLLHCSSAASKPKHRRVLHLVYHGGARCEEPWHRAC